MRNPFSAALGYFSFLLAFPAKSQILLGISLCLLAANLTAQAANAYGVVERLDGKVSIIDSKGQTRVAHVNDTIMEGDTIVTGVDGELQVRTSDYGFAAYRPKSRITIQSFRAEADADDNMVLAIVYGGLRSISGWIGKYNREKYKIRTPNATVGIRGTDHEPLHIPLPPAGEEPIAEPGTYEKVNSGQTSLQNPAGEVIVNAGESAFSSHDAKKPPQKLAHIPAIYKPTANESKIDARKEQLAKEVEQRRAEKQKAAAAPVATAKSEASAKEEAAHKKATAKHKPVTK